MRACLTIEVGEGTPRICELPLGQIVTLGRNRGNTVVLKDEHVSRWHAEIYQEASRWFIRECDPLKGPKLDGQRIQQPMPLADGQLIGLGDTRLRVHLNGVPVSSVQTNCSLSPPSPRPAPAADSVTVLHADELT